MLGPGIIVNDPNVFYFNTPATIFDVPEWIPNEEKIKNLKNHHLVIADFSKEHYGDNSSIAELIYELLDANGVNFILLTHNPDDHLTKPRLLFYPYWYYYVLEDNTKGKFEKISPVDTIEKKFKLSCLNFNHRFHRVYNYQILKHHPDFKNWLFTMHRNSQSNPLRYDDYPLPKEILEDWEPIDTAQKLVRIKSIIDHPACTDSYVQLITESTVLSTIFLTEKTWKPVACGQLFLLIGNPGSMKFLESMGVDIFSDIIDHKYYDSEVDWQLRIHKVHELINDLLKQDLYKINQETYYRRKHNAECFFNGTFGNKYRQDLLSCINKLN